MLCFNEVPEAALHKFWDLESIGISDAPVEAADVSAVVKQQVDRVDSVYRVRVGQVARVDPVDHVGLGVGQVDHVDLVDRVGVRQVDRVDPVDRVCVRLLTWSHKDCLPNSWWHQRCG